MSILKDAANHTAVCSTGTIEHQNDLSRPVHNDYCTVIVHVIQVKDAQIGGTFAHIGVLETSVIRYNPPYRLIIAVQLI